LDRAEASGYDRRPYERLENPFAPAARTCLRGQQNGDVGIFEPQIAQHSHWQVMAQRAREHGPIDASSRGTSYDINDRAQLDVSANLAQQLVIDFLGVVFRIAAV